MTERGQKLKGTYSPTTSPGWHGIERRRRSSLIEGIPTDVATRERDRIAASDQSPPSAAIEARLSMCVKVELLRRAFQPTTGDAADALLRSRIARIGVYAAHAPCAPSLGGYLRQRPGGRLIDRYEDQRRRAQPPTASVGRAGEPSDGREARLQVSRARTSRRRTAAGTSRHPRTRSARQGWTSG